MNGKRRNSTQTFPTFPAAREPFRGSRVVCCGRRGSKKSCLVSVSAQPHLRSVLHSTPPQSPARSRRRTRRRRRRPQSLLRLQPVRHRRRPRLARHPPHGPRLRLLLAPHRHRSVPPPLRNGRHRRASQRRRSALPRSVRLRSAPPRNPSRPRQAARPHGLPQAPSVANCVSSAFRNAPSSSVNRLGRDVAQTTR